MKATLVIILLVLCLGCTNAPPSAIKWEYKVISAEQLKLKAVSRISAPSSDQTKMLNSAQISKAESEYLAMIAFELNELGMQGWELISKDEIYIFKRKR